MKLGLVSRNVDMVSKEGTSDIMKEFPDLFQGNWLLASTVPHGFAQGFSTSSNASTASTTGTTRTTTR